MGINFIYIIYANVKKEEAILPRKTQMEVMLKEKSKTASNKRN